MNTNKGLLFESQIPEVITKGHAVNAGRVALIQERAEFSAYPMVPIKYPFQKTVRICNIYLYNIYKDLQDGDLVYFQKKEGKPSQPWTIGRVEEIVRSGRDNLIRRAIIKYQNFGEVNEYQVQEDLDELQKKIDQVRGRTDQDDVEIQKEDCDDEDTGYTGVDE